MNPAVSAMLNRYKCATRSDYENALKEIIQEIALLGLWRSKFFEHAAFYGGTALRILYGLNRFSEDLDFSLLTTNDEFRLTPYLEAINIELTSMDFNVEISQKTKNIESAIDSAFIKAETKETLLKIEVPEEVSERIGQRDVLKIKVEVDTNPPGAFETEAKTLLLPLPFSVKVFAQPDLFAGKTHAILQRAWKTGRVKGRDFYDFVWYVSRDIPVRIHHLEQRLRQTGGWNSTEPLTIDELLRMLDYKFACVDFEAAKRDVLPFIRDHIEVEMWSPEFFRSLLKRLTAI